MPIIKWETTLKAAAKRRGLYGATHSVGGLNEGVVDSNDLDVIVLNGVAEDDTADTAKSVDTDLDDHFDGLFLGSRLKSSLGRVDGRIVGSWDCLMMLRWKDGERREGTGTDVEKEGVGRDLKAQRQSQEGKGPTAIGWARQLNLWAWAGRYCYCVVPSKTKTTLASSSNLWYLSGPPCVLLESSDSGRGLSTLAGQFF